ncbi:MAG TPA: cation acetate symporter, partial [Mycobacterium sp.]|nr:cation acetate symporter [Mycobacterium sp.]
YVVVGGMKGTTWVQIVKAGLLMSGTIIITLIVLGDFGFNLSKLLGQAAEQSGQGAAFLEPGLRYATDAQGLTGKIDLISLGLALVLGTAGLPHILIRFYTVPTARDARKSVIWAIWIIGAFYLMTLVLGFGAAALVGSAQIAEQNPAGNTAAPQLAQAAGEIVAGEIGGTILLAFIAAVAFATILAVVAGLTLASSSSYAHDIYANVIHKGDAPEGTEVRVARIAAVCIGAVAIVLGIFAQNLNVAFLVALAFAVAASANLPAILYSLFWKRFNTQGAVWAIYAGLGSAVLLVIFSPVVSGSETALFPNADFAWFPLSNPGIVSIPVGFLAGWLGTMLSKESDNAKWAELEVRSMTGAGAERAVIH